MTRAQRDLAGRTAVVTGANTGIGRATAMGLAQQGATVVLACRSEEKARPALDAVRASGGEADFEPLDLADLASVHASASRLAARFASIDILVNNAGVAGAVGMTKDGFELAFGTNHIGHFVLTLLLLPRLRAAQRPRIVNLSSVAHFKANGIDFDAARRPTRSPTRMREYAMSKLANVLFTKELARRLRSNGPHTYAVHPGTVASDAWRHMPWPIRPLIKLGMASNEEGAKTTLYCALSPEVAEHTGRYYDACKVKAPSARAEDPDLARELWERSVEWTGVDLPDGEVAVAAPA
jgi:NAD(P)-dependent dehydrogenase (short-subunit alcohol dehydrogenase family)